MYIYLYYILMCILLYMLYMFTYEVTWQRISHHLTWTSTKEETVVILSKGIF